MSFSIKKSEQSIFAAIDQRIEQRLNEISFKPKQGTFGYLTKKQACLFLGISLSCLNNYLRDKLIKKYKIGGRILLSKSELGQLIKSFQ